MATAYPIPEGSTVLLWAGEDPVLQASLLEKLEAAGIPFRGRAIGDDQIAPSADPLPIDTKPRFGFEVMVPTTTYDAAKGILENLLNEEPKNMELPDEGLVAESLPPSMNADEPLTEVVWSGIDERIADFLLRAIEENESPVHLEKGVELSEIFVGRTSLARAKEIVREVSEGTPPQ
jgi:hypothetical protein